MLLPGESPPASFRPCSSIYPPCSPLGHTCWSFIYLPRPPAGEAHPPSRSCAPPLQGCLTLVHPALSGSQTGWLYGDWCITEEPGSLCAHQVSTQPLPCCPTCQGESPDPSLVELQVGTSQHFFNSRAHSAGPDLGGWSVGKRCPANAALELRCLASNPARAISWLGTSEGVTLGLDSPFVRCG